MLAATTLLLAAASPAAAADFDLLAHTPVGSWQVREEVRTDHKGKQSVTVVKTKMLEQTGSDYWMEVETQAYKVKGNGDRKANGPPAVLKVLVEQDALKADANNVLRNLTGIGKEIIMQTGDAQPMRVREGGMLASAMMESFGAQLSFSFAQTGEESVQVPAGTFSAKTFEGEASADFKIMLSRVQVQSETQTWYSTEVPFGTVKSVTDATVNGKPEHTESTLVEYGATGAASVITQEPMEMPSLGLGGL